MVFGDSITARFNDVTGDDLQGYWSRVADEVGAGFVNPGPVGYVRTRALASESSLTLL